MLFIYVIYSEFETFRFTSFCINKHKKYVKQFIFINREDCSNIFN